MVFSIRQFVDLQLRLKHFALLSHLLTLALDYVAHAYLLAIAMVRQTQQFVKTTRRSEAVMLVVLLMRARVDVAHVYQYHFAAVIPILQSAKTIPPIQVVRLPRDWHQSVLDDVASVHLRQPQRRHHLHFLVKLAPVFLIPLDVSLRF